MSCLAALVAFLLPARGRHCVAPAAAEEPAQAAEDEGVSPADMTRFDMPPGRVRPYVWPGDEDGGR